MAKLGAPMTPLPRRVVRLLITLLLVTLFTALMLDLLPGDPAVAIAGGDVFNVSPERIEAIREELGLNDPVLVRYWNWLKEAAQGNLGTSLRTRQPVMDLVLPRIPVTLELMVVAQVVALSFALITSPFAALRPGSWFDRGIGTASFAMVATPSFVGGLVLIQVGAVWLHVLPSVGFRPLTEGITENLKSVILPSLALATAQAGVYARVLRSEMIASMNEDYILMARSKGLSNSYILARHAMRPSSLPLLTLIGLSTGGLIGGSVIVENLFGLPGLGRLMVDSIINRDLITVQGLVALVTVSYVAINFLTDLTYFVADPRIRSG